jgi:hydroxyacylglutathione hydrolase
MLERFSDDGLAQRSYLIGCERTRQAVVIDPRRDVDGYLAAAAKHGFTITHVIETHIHADFVSGARELAAHGSIVVSGPGAGLQFPFHEATDGETLRIGDLTLELLHTPGHTPEHITIVVREAGAPVRAFTGDTLFVGAVGRPDLLGEHQARHLAEQLYDSLTRLRSLPDDVEVHPGHGAGSLCGSGIGGAPHSTIGAERLINPWLQYSSKSAFVTAVLNDLPETPPYFPRMKIVNQRGPAVLGLGQGVARPGALAAADAIRHAAGGDLIIDLRSPEAFGAGHPAGAINIGFGPRIGYWSGWVVPADARLILMTSEAAQTEEVRRQLLRVGFDDVVGYVQGGFDAWTKAGGPVARIEVICARELRDRIAHGDRPVVVDVRTAREWSAGHVEGALNIPVGDLPNRAAELRGLPAVATICESGFRSSLAASLIVRAGGNALNVSDGTAAYRALEGRLQVS